FVLGWIQSECLRKAGFIEDRDGSCRLSTALAVKLCETSDTWRRLINPWAEWLSLKLRESAIPARSHFSRNVVRVATRLTQRHRRAVKGSAVPAVALPKAEHVCNGCDCWYCATLDGSDLKSTRLNSSHVSISY